MELRRTRRSLYYVAGYLLVGGLGFLFFPVTSLQVLFSKGPYNLIMVRFVGALLLSLGIFVAQLIRHRTYSLYPTTLVVRAIILISLIWLYLLARDPMMMVLTAIVGLGFIMTYISLMIDTRPQEPPPSPEDLV
jgi:hypothetical protein